MPKQDFPKGIQDLERKIYAKFLGTTGDEEDNMPVGINARISSSEEYRMLTLQGNLAERGVESAKTYFEVATRLSIAKRGLGRKEIVEATRSTPTVNPSPPSEGYGYRPGEE